MRPPVRRHPNELRGKTIPLAAYIDGKRHVIGEVTAIRPDEYGAEVDAMVFPEYMKLINPGDITEHLSVGPVIDAIHDKKERNA